MTGTTPALSPRVFLVGAPASGPMLHLLGCSRWRVDQILNVDAAAGQIERGSVPVLICGESEWREVVEVARRSVRPPGIIVVTDAPNGTEWAEVLKANAHYLDVSKLEAGELFSLLNLLWRNWHAD
jgi:hypothetical protein